MLTGDAEIAATKCSLKMQLYSFCDQRVRLLVSDMHGGRYARTSMTHCTGELLREHAETHTDLSTLSCWMLEMWSDLLVSKVCGGVATDKQRQGHMPSWHQVPEAALRY